MKIKASTENGLLVLSIGSRNIVSHQEIDGEHHLILVDRPAETYGGAKAAMARIIEVLREEGGDVRELSDFEADLAEIEESDNPLMHLLEEI